MIVAFPKESEAPALLLVMEFIGFHGVKGSNRGLGRPEANLVRFDMNRFHRIFRSCGKRSSGSNQAVSPVIVDSWQNCHIWSQDPKR